MVGNSAHEHDDADLEDAKDDGDHGFSEENMDTSLEKLKLVQPEFNHDENAYASSALKHALHVLFVDLPLRPLRWFSMLQRDLDLSFVFGVLVTYGWSQGFGSALYRIAGNYFWKDTQRVQPATAQLYSGIISSVWDWKPVWGLSTDLFPVAGFHRRPYFILSGLLSFFSLLVLLIKARVQNGIAVIMLLLYTLGVTIADVTIDAEVAKHSREKPSLATHIQTLCSISTAVWGFIGFSTSGFIVHIMGPKNALGLLSISGALFFLLGLTLNESPLRSFPYSEVGKRVESSCKKIWKTMSCPQVWKPTLYMYISWASSPSVAEGKFYWYTDQQHGLGFSQEFVGMSFAIGSIGAFLGTIIYQSVLKNCSFRKILFWAQILVFVGGMVDLFLVLRWNLKLHIPDALFFLFDEILIQSVGRLKWIPQLVLCAKLCPAGIEGTFFALLMAVDNVGLLTSTWGGALLQHSLGITRDNYSNLWLATLIRTLMRLLPLGVLFLVPDVDPSSQVIPAELLIALGSDTNENDEDMELVEKGSS